MHNPKDEAICFIPGQDLFLDLTQQRPQAHAKGSAESKAAGAAPQYSRFWNAFFPCAWMLVSIDELPEGMSAGNTTTSSKATSIEILTGTWGMCHTEVALKHAVCPRQYVAASSGWLPNSLVRHPNVAACMYAVLDVEHRAFLMDGLAHRCIRAKCGPIAGRQAVRFVLAP